MFAVVFQSINVVFSAPHTIDTGWCGFFNFNSSIFTTIVTITYDDDDDDDDDFCRTESNMKLLRRTG